MKVEEIPKLSLPALVLTYLKGIMKLAGMEKAYVKKEVKAGLSQAPVGLALAVAGLILLALGGLMFLVTSVLILCIWLQPWAAALIVAGALVIPGILLALIGLIKAKKDLARARASFSQAGKDIKCLRQK
ncbi:MAG TPA: phage holin family protein [Desulfomonilia bacterium]